MAEVTAGDCHEDRISSKGENLTRQLAYTERGEDQRSEDIKNRGNWFKSLLLHLSLEQQASAESPLLAVTPPRQTQAPATTLSERLEKEREIV